MLCFYIITSVEMQKVYYHITLIAFDILTIFLISTSIQRSISMKSIATFIKKEPVLSIATILAVLSMFFVIPSKEYLTYIDFRTLELLLCFMLVVAGFQDIGAFSYLGMFFVIENEKPKTAFRNFDFSLLFYQYADYKRCGVTDICSVYNYAA